MPMTLVIRSTPSSDAFEVSYWSQNRKCFVVMAHVLEPLVL